MASQWFEAGLKLLKIASKRCRADNFSSGATLDRAQEP